MLSEDAPAAIPLQERISLVKYQELPHPSLTNPPDKRLFFDGYNVKSHDIGDSKSSLNRHFHEAGV